MNPCLRSLPLCTGIDRVFGLPSLVREVADDRGKMKRQWILLPRSPAHRPGLPRGIAPHGHLRQPLSKTSFPAFFCCNQPQYLIQGRFPQRILPPPWFLPYTGIILIIINNAARLFSAKHLVYHARCAADPHSHIQGAAGAVALTGAALDT